MTESLLVRQILLRFGSHPQLRLWRSQPLVARTREGRVVRALPLGWPDITGVLAPSGRLLGIEVKTDKGRVSPAQAAIHETWQKFGAVLVVARDVEDVTHALRLAGCYV
jgi:hypothetical protein